MKKIILFLILLISSEIFSQQLAKKVNEIPPPSGFKRVKAEKGSFGEYLQNLPIKQENSIVYLYDGTQKANQEAQYAVINMDIGNRDLQQCADALMRLFGEYYFQKEEYDKIKFHFTNGTKTNFRDYAEGYRVRKKGKKILWGKYADRDYSYKSFRRYMDLVFAYSGTSSLKNYDSVLKDSKEPLEIGNFLVQERTPFGHAVIVMDMAKNPEGQIVYLLAQSYMPAQEIHILRNYKDLTLSPWYAYPSKSIRTPEWDFSESDWSKWKE